MHVCAEHLYVGSRKTQMMQQNMYPMLKYPIPVNFSLNFFSKFLLDSPHPQRAFFYKKGNCVQSTKHT
jgi:hypothetical protein